MKHTVNLMKAQIMSKKGNVFDVIVDKYSGNRYKVVECQQNPGLVGREYQFGHGLFNRRKLKEC